MTCSTCADWGPTITSEEGPAVPCPRCGRLTWANLGVNCPAGMAWDFSSTKATVTLEQLRGLCQSETRPREGGLSDAINRRIDELLKSY